MPHQRRYRLPLLVVLAAVAHLSCADEAQPEPLPISRSMKGDAKLGPYIIQAGLLTATFTHSGTKSFTVTISHEGKQASQLLETVGAYAGTQVEYIEAPGRYWLTVKATGPWTVALSQP